MSDDGNVPDKQDLCILHGRRDRFDPESVIFRPGSSRPQTGDPSVREIAVNRFFAEIAVDEKILLFCFRDFRDGKIREPRGSGTDDPRHHKHAVLRPAVLAGLPGLQNDVYLCPRRRLIEHLRILLLSPGADMKIKLRLSGGLDPAGDMVGGVRLQHLP